MTGNGSPPTRRLPQPWKLDPTNVDVLRNRAYVLERTRGITLARFRPTARR